MALVQCHECGGTVSTTASACPHCGAPPPKPSASPPPLPNRPATPRAPQPSAAPAPAAKPTRQWPVWVAVIIGGIVFLNWIGSPPTPPSTPAPVVTPRPPPPLEPLAAEFQKQVDAKNWVEARARLAVMQQHYPEAAQTKAALLQKPAIEKAAAEQVAKQNAEAAARAKKLAAEAEARRKNAYAGLRKERDEVQGITFYHAPELPMNRVANYWGLYLAQPDQGSPYVRFKFMYTDDDWLFVERMTLQIDGQTLPAAEFGHFAVKRDNSGSRIWEWKDEHAPPSTFELFDRVAASKKTVLRLHGQQYYDDRTITDAEKRGIRKILKAYRDRMGLAHPP